MRRISKRFESPECAHLYSAFFFPLTHFSSAFHLFFFCSSSLLFPSSVLLSLPQTPFPQKVLLPPRRGPFTMLSAMSSWDPVYRLVKQIPRGRVTTYGALAKSLRLRGGARTAGRAMAASPTGKGIPWHRVVGAGGKLLIREPYSSLQRKLLESEGVEVLESRVRIKECLWTPPRPKRNR
jgi:methylated-DNA-protein-cysteine methyltransferase-like protein